jgi:predicted aspartyl protease
MHTLSYRHSYEYSRTDIGITIPVILRAGNESIKIPDTKLDTGASHCIFARWVGESLNINIEQGEVSIVALANRSRFTTYGHTVTVSAMGLEIESVVYFAADEAVVRNVLGRQGWIQKLRVGLVDYESLLYVSHFNDEGD